VRGVNGVLPDEMRTLYSKMRRFLDRSGFPPVFGDLPSQPIIDVAPPDGTLSATVQAQVRHAARSTVKIYASAPQCQRRTEGSGFVFASGYVLTNAHVVAGGQQVSVVQLGEGSLPATVVVYDPDRDIAVLRVPDLSAARLRFASGPASTGDPAVVLGYPQDGPLTVRSARVRTRTTVSGADIYGNGSVDREVYSVRAVVRSGNSGGPLLADDGTVLGVVFATALDSPDTGFVLTAGEVAADARQGARRTAPVATGDCTPE
jgi:S1-C subfamily serine protease